jgi:hypothetical protein
MQKCHDNANLKGKTQKCHHNANLIGKTQKMPRQCKFKRKNTKKLNDNANLKGKTQKCHHNANLKEKTQNLHCHGIFAFFLLNLHSPVKFALCHFCVFPFKFALSWHFCVFSFKFSLWWHFCIFSFKYHNEKLKEKTQKCHDNANLKGNTQK